MKFSVYDPETERYYYYSSDREFYVDVTNYYAKIPFIPWQEIKIRFPSHIEPIGSGEWPQGVIVHPDELMRPSCTDRKDWVWAGLLILLEWVLIKARKG